jgi:hypothetical protein
MLGSATNISPHGPDVSVRVALFHYDDWEFQLVGGSELHACDFELHTAYRARYSMLAIVQQNYQRCYAIISDESCITRCDF